MNSEILNDPRPIKSICFNDAKDSMYHVDNGYIIEAYGEPGPHCVIPFYRILKDGAVCARVPGDCVEVVYK